MTEAEWLACEDSEEHVAHLLSGMPETRLRRVAIAWCRMCWDFLSVVGKQAIAASERCFDGNTVTERIRSAQEAKTEYYSHVVRRVIHTIDGKPTEAELGACAAYSVSDWEEQSVRTALRAAHQFATACRTPDGDLASVLREIAGNPSRPVILDSAWRTFTAVALASQMHESRDFSAMPILADALQDAGCENEDILNHCRDEKQPHVRGCWVVDLVLGKK